MTVNKSANGLAVKSGSFTLYSKSRLHLAAAVKLLHTSLMGLAIIAGTNAMAATITPAQQLENDYQKVITTAYRELATGPLFTLASPDLPGLIREVTQADSNHRPDRVAGLIAANMDIIQKNINAKELPELTRLVLRNHATGLAQQILDYANSNGDRFSQAKQQFAMAKYYAEYNQWDSAIAHLKTFDLSNDLTGLDSDQAYIMAGAALQAKKKHREALAYYKKVKPDSAHYMIAQLDLALVYIRQDWWTDAQIALEDVIKVARKEDSEMVNRLYTVMGFSQLQQGFYRNARDSFRRVKINSAYSNRALLGIGMSALNQEDYNGAINVFQKLKTQGGNDSSIAQAYLLEAFTLNKAKQNDAATVQYGEAINYYSDRANYYNKLLKTINEQSQVAKTLPTLELDSELLKEHVDISVMAEKLSSLSKLQGYSLSQNTLQQSATVYARLYKNYMDAMTEAVTKKQFVFNSYLNQSNFGLTRLYDSH